MSLRLWTRLDTQPALSCCLQNDNIAIASGGSVVGVVVMAPLTMCLDWRCSRVMCLSSRHSWFCARYPPQGGFYIEGTATLSDCQLTSNSAGSVRGLFRRVVRQLHVDRTCTEHDDSEGQGTKIVQCPCPTLVSRLLCASLVRPEPLRRRCGYGRDLTTKLLYRVACKTTTSPSPERGESSVWW